MYSPNKPRPKAGYQCKICGKEGGQPDSHWFQLCPFKGQHNEATTYIPPKKGYVCKYCLKPGGEKDSHWFQQCPHYKKNYHSRHHRSGGGGHSSGSVGVGAIPQPYHGMYGMPMTTPGAPVYDYHHHPAVAANGMILHYSQYPPTAAGLSAGAGQMYYMRPGNSATTTGEHATMAENAEAAMGVYEYAPHLYSPPFMPHAYSYPVPFASNDASRRQPKRPQYGMATESKEETDTRRIDATNSDSKQNKRELGDNMNAFQGVSVDMGDSHTKAKNGSVLHGTPERTRMQQKLNEASKTKQSTGADSSTDNRVVIEDKQI